LFNVIIAKICKYICCLHYIITLNTPYDSTTIIKFSNITEIVAKVLYLCTRSYAIDPTKAHRGPLSISLVVELKIYLLIGCTAMFICDDDDEDDENDDAVVGVTAIGFCPSRNSAIARSAT